MDVVNSVQLYFDEIINLVGSGIKCLIMDDEITQTISLVYRQSDLVSKDIYLFENIRNLKDEPIKHVKAIVLIKPTNENLKLLCSEVKKTNFGSYYIFFSGTVDDQILRKLADSDKLSSSIKEIQELYCDYLPMNSHLFSLGIDYSFKGDYFVKSSLEKLVNGFSSICRSLRKNPIIRYQANSKICNNLAESLMNTVYSNGDLSKNMKDKNNGHSLLIILDRRFDPLTPLITQWTYQAMVHELMGIKNNRVNLTDQNTTTTTNNNNNLKEIVLSIKHDQVFSNNAYLNFGELASNIKKMIDEYQETVRSNQKINTINDMKKFIENYPQFKKISGSVNKHVSLVSELSRLVAENNLLELSELEQEIISKNNLNLHYNKVKLFIEKQTVKQHDCVRLILILILRYSIKPNSQYFKDIVRLIEQQSYNPKYPQIMSYFSLYSSNLFQITDLFDDSMHPISFGKRFFKEIKGVDNILTQHVPSLSSVINDVFAGKLKNDSFPFVRKEFESVHKEKKWNDIIVFVVGGVTYVESSIIYNFNKAHPGTSVLLGGTTIHNSKSYLNEIYSTFQSQSEDS